MEAWSVHHLFKLAEDKLGAAQALEIQKYAQNLIHSDLPVIFSLKHLAKITQSDYKFLRATVGRKRESANYKMFSIKKRSGGHRFIHAVSGQLLPVQQFLNSEVLQKVSPHPSSFAFHRNGGIRNCAAMHCGARWLFQLDLVDFFYDITEVDVFRIFHGLGYRNLLAFELSRICTTTRLPSPLIRFMRRDNRPDSGDNYPYRAKLGLVGALPQGAPTSPMLSNLVSKNLDTQLFEFAKDRGFVYTRYADDLTISTTELPEAISKDKIYRDIVGIIRRCGFRENIKKLGLPVLALKRLCWAYW